MENVLSVKSISNILCASLSPNASLFAAIHDTPHLAIYGSSDGVKRQVIALKSKTRHRLSWIAEGLVLLQNEDESMIVPSKPHSKCLVREALILFVKAVQNKWIVAEQENHEDIILSLYEYDFSKMLHSWKQKFTLNLGVYRCFQVNELLLVKDVHLKMLRMNFDGVDNLDDIILATKIASQLSPNLKLQAQLLQNLFEQSTLTKSIMELTEADLKEIREIVSHPFYYKL